MIIINSLNESRFTLNGIQFFKNYISKIAGDKIKIFNCYENSDVLVDFTEYTDIELNGTTYESAEALQAGIIDVIYSRLTSGGSSSPVLNQNNVGRYFIFGELIGEGDITNTQAVAWLNSQPFFLIFDETKTPIFFVFTRGGKKYIFIFLDGKGKWGNSPPLISDVNPYSVNNVKILSIFNTEPDDVTDNPGATIIDLGNLPTGNYLLAANSTERDFSDAGTFDENDNIVTYYFSYTQEEVLYFVQFVGAAGIYSGTLTEADLVATTNSNIAPVNQNNTGVKINIGNFYVNPLTPLEQTVTKVNTQYPLNISEIQSPVLLYGIKLETPPGFTGPGSPPAIPTVKYWFLFLGGKGSWGVGGTPITSAMLYVLPSENLQPDDITESDTTEIIPLGNIESTDNFLSTANSEERDFSDEDMTYYFSYTVTEGEGEDAQDVLYITIFVGEPGTYGGSTGNNFVEGDFIGITNSIISPTVIPNLQSVLESGSIATIVTGWQITSDDGSDISTVGAGTDGIGFTYNDNFLNIENDLVTINSRVQIQPAVSDNQAVTKGQLDAVADGLNIPDDFQIYCTYDSATDRGNNMLYRTDTDRNLDISVYTEAEVWSTNWVGIMGNTILVTGQLYNEVEATGNLFLLSLIDCKIINNVLIPKSFEYRELTEIYKNSNNVPFALHASRINRGFWYLTTRTQSSNSTVPTQILKVNPYDLTDLTIKELAVDGDYNGSTGMIQVYKNNIYMMLSASTTAGNRLVKFDENLENPEVLFTVGNISSNERVRRDGVFIIYNDEVFIPYVDNTSAGYDYVGIFKYNLLKKQFISKNLITLSTGSTNQVTPHWISEFNGAILFHTGGSTTPNNWYVAVSTSDLSLITKKELPFKISNNNSVMNNGDVHLNPELTTTATLLRGKYNDGDSFIADSSIGFYSLGSPERESYKETVISKTSQLENNSFIPLTGTTEGNPVTGDIEIEDYTSIISQSATNPDFTRGLQFDDGNMRFFFNDADTGYVSFFGAGDSTTGFAINTDDPAARGLIGEQDFTPNIQSLDYVQKKYVDTHAPRILHNDVTDSTTITGTTTNTIIKSYLIPANTLSAGTLSFVAKYLKIGSNDNVTLTAYIRSSDTLSGTDGRIGIWTPIVAGRQFIEYGRTITIKAGGSTYGFPDFISNQYGESDNSSLPSGVTIDFEVDNYIILTLQNANADDAMVQKSAEVIFKKSTN
ncbi:hypothetical protein E0W68_09485 [Flavobacterium salilacus subsp. salilacus]|uniref:hypothetical protein n=1 Tax=Flavobacterium TaxID=237 RepID=UPI001074DAE1|nr:MULTISPECIES: hypothetical protein [Flavobacterium]KAF2518246.1 hypothetical protein E0W68_09485 [Flavobacterium salilacus subsp. salilacus]MBE1615344.1 hypothetical protein [Flavobacterium sp. SaA2.13]